jgi:plastocyanin
MWDRLGNRAPGAALALVLTALLAGCARDSGETKDEGAAAPAEAAAPSAAPFQVTIDNFSFHPRRLTVPVGAAVTWLNRDDVPHTATSAAEPRRFHSEALDTDGRFTHVFTAPGTYDYFCAVHPHMTGQVVVK